jgi:hypothetical protein
LKLVNYMEKLEKETIGFKIYCKKNNWNNIYQLIKNYNWKSYLIWQYLMILFYRKKYISKW